MRRPSRLLAALSLLALAGVGSASAAVKAKPTGPTYRTYVSPPGALAAPTAGEPSLGVNWKTGAVFYQGQLETERITFDAAGDDTWKNVTAGTTGQLTLDAIAASDNATGRIFVSQLVGFGSLMAYSDDDGRTWSTSTGSGLPAGYDHQSVGVGPFPAGINGSYPHAVYYCSQEAYAALCARSDNGGQTFGLSVTAWDFVTCGAIHGHIRVAPDGTVYVPNRNCTGRQGVAVSTDAGRTFTVRTVPGSTSGSNGDPSIATGRDGTAYFGFSDGTGKAMVAVSRDRGLGWTSPYDVGKQVGVVNASFPEVIAGDGDRAAMAFLGTKTPGDPQDRVFGMNEDESRYVGAEYHLYVATTYDRGRTWKTVDVTPKDPVQRGRICLAGTTCTGNDRNLLDFMDIQVDRQGRVLVGWSDGCTRTCVSSNLASDNTFDGKAMITRQNGGQGLFRTPPPVL